MVICASLSVLNVKMLFSFNSSSPSHSSRVRNGTMAFADISLFSYPSLNRLSNVLDYQSDPQVRTQSFPSTYPLYLLDVIFSKKSFVLFGRLPRSYLALYGVQVPQTGCLPLASFRFRVTMDTLALS